PPSWSHVGAVSPGQNLQLTFALRQRGLGRLAQLVDAISDPRSPQYGKFLTLEQLRDLVQPSPGTLLLVLKWLRGHGVEQCHSVTTLDFLECHMPASLLLGPFQPCQATRRCPWSPSPAWAPPAVPAWGPSRALPALPAWLWPSPGPGLGAAGEGVSRGQRCLLPELWIPACAMSLLCARQGEACTGSQRSGRRSHNANLPCQGSAVGRGRGASRTVKVPPGPSTPWCSAGRHESQEPFLAWLVLLSNMSWVPWVHSVSYGDDEDSLSLPYLHRVNAELMKAAARGLSVLFASGDDGAGCRRVSGGNHTFRPSFPASSPYVTTVGGTSFKNPFLVTTEVSDYISGGGFSNVFPMPSYQV
ncbi:Tripeptidyl-peptidase 1, partial [Dryobates pubescens]